MTRRGTLLALSSPSGAGKSSLARALVAADPGIVTSVSVTTRTPRPSEVDGTHYHFVDAAGFERARVAGGLLEWARVHGNLYGTPREPVERHLAAGRDVLFDIDWQGARSLRAAMPGDVVGVFLLPPSAAELRARLEGRAEDDAATIRRRLDNACGEIPRWREYDHVLVNEDFAATLGALRGILRAAREGRRAPPSRPAGVAALAESLVRGLAEAVPDEEHAPPAMRA